MGEDVNQSAKTGKFVKDSTVQGDPEHTITQETGGGAKGPRDARTGEFATKQKTQSDPGGTVTHKG